MSTVGDVDLAARLAFAWTVQPYEPDDWDRDASHLREMLEAMERPENEIRDELATLLMRLRAEEAARDVHTNGNGNGHTDGLGSWEPLDLVVAGTITPKPATIGGGFFYPLLRHTVFGSHSAGKTMFAAAAVSIEIKAGRNCAWLDVDGGSPGDLLERLRQFGCTDEQITAHLDFYAPQDPLGTQIGEYIRRRCIERDTVLAIVDSSIGSMTQQGLEPNDATAIEQWWQLVGDALKGRAGAVVLIDHTGHNVDAQGRPMNSARKLQAVGCALALSSLSAIGRGKTGRTKITIAKDRPSFHGPIGDVLGILVVTSDPATSTLTWAMEAPPKDTADHWRPTVLMEKVSRWLDAHSGEHSRNRVVTDLGMNAKATRDAIDELVAGGFAVERTDGAHRTAARFVAHTRLYTEANDPLIERPKGPDEGPSFVQPQADRLTGASSDEQMALDRLNHAVDDTAARASSDFVQLRPDEAGRASSTSSPSPEGTKDEATKGEAHQ